MTVRPAPSAAAPAEGGAGRTPTGRPADSPEEAAKQFESVLVRQFVEVMTKDLFQSEEGGVMTGQADLQRDTLTDTLADHLVESGTFGIADLLLAQWARTGEVPPAAPPAGAPGRGGGDAPLTLDDALRMYPGAQVRPPSIDNGLAPLRDA